MHKVNFFSGHKVLKELADQLSNGLGYKEFSRPINVVVGSHISPRRLPHGLNIALQTEHYFDADGQRLWRKESLFRRIKTLLKYDVVLDLSIYNKKHYHVLPKALRRKIHYGPNIFPENPINFAPIKLAPVIVFGASSPRREKTLSSLNPLLIKRLPIGIFGQHLQNQLALSRGVVNIHFAEGAYTEWPRLLSCYLAGKVVFSDPLGEMTTGQHYFSLESIEIQDISPEEIFIRFRDEIARKNIFSKWLETVL